VISQLALTITMLAIYINVHQLIKSCFFLILLNAVQHPPLFRDCIVSSQKYEKKAFIQHRLLYTLILVQNI